MLADCRVCVGKNVVYSAQTVDANIVDWIKLYQKQLAPCTQIWLVWY